MKSIFINGLSREKAREVLIKLPRRQEFLIDTLSDGRKVFIRTDGIKMSREDGKEIDNLDITIHYEGEPKRKISYLDDVVVDLIKKEMVIHKDGLVTLLNAIKDSIELMSLKEIFKKYPKLMEFEKEIQKAIEKANLQAHSIELLLSIIKCLALQEDINYWGINPKTKQPYEGRYKPYNALIDYFLKKMPLSSVIKKHMLY